MQVCSIENAPTCVGYDLICDALTGKNRGRGSWLPGRLPEIGRRPGLPLARRPLRPRPAHASCFLRLSPSSGGSLERAGYGVEQALLWDQLLGQVTGLPPSKRRNPCLPQPDPSVTHVCSSSHRFLVVSCACRGASGGIPEWPRILVSWKFCLLCPSTLFLPYDFQFLKLPGRLRQTTSAHHPPSMQQRLHSQEPAQGISCPCKEQGHKVVGHEWAAKSGARKLQNLDLPEDEPSLGKMAKHASHSGTFAVSSPLPQTPVSASPFHSGELGFVAFFFSGCLGSRQPPLLFSASNKPSLPSKGPHPQPATRLTKQPGWHGLNGKSFSKALSSTEGVQCPDCRAPCIICLYHDSSWGRRHPSYCAGSILRSRDVLCTRPHSTRVLSQSWDLSSTSHPVPCFFTGLGRWTPFTGTARTAEWQGYNVRSQVFDCCQN